MGQRQLSTSDLIAQKSGFPNIALPLFSAMLCAAALPNEIFLYGLPPLGFMAVIPLYFALLKAKNPRAAALTCSIFGAAHHALTSYWLFFYKGYALWTLGTTTLGYAVVYAVAGLYAFFALKTEKSLLRPFLFAAGWAAFEYLKSTGFLGYPWGLLPYSLTRVPLFLQMADITGVYGISFLLALSSAVFSELLLARSLVPRALLMLCILWALSAGYGFLALNSTIPLKTTLRATLVQQNTDPWTAGEIAALKANIDPAMAEMGSLASRGDRLPEIIVFSETSLRRPFSEYKEWFEDNPKSNPLLPSLRTSGAYLLTGAPVVLDWDTYEATNSVLLVSPDGELLDTYAKIHPVPFAEAIPLWEFDWFRKFMREVVGLEGGWTMGKKLTVFTMPSRKAGQKIAFSTPICFEDAFADLCRAYFLSGAELLINLTNDSWSKTQSAQIQHWAIARFRAIENRRTLVRSTNAGVTSVIDAWGRSVFEYPQFKGIASTFDVPVYEPSVATIYTAYGEWCAMLLTLLFATRVVFNYLRWKKSARDTLSIGFAT